MGLSVGVGVGLGVGANVDVDVDVSVSADMGVSGCEYRCQVLDERMCRCVIGFHP